MKIRYENTAEDFIACVRHTYGRSPTYWMRVAAFLAIPAVLILAAGGIAAAARRDSTCVEVAALLAVSLPLAFWLLLRWLYSRHLRRLTLQDPIRAALCWHEMELADGRLAISTEYESETVELRAVEKVASSGTHTFVYTGPRKAHIIPRRSVPEAEYDKFVDALRREWEQAQRR